MSAPAKISVAMCTYKGEHFLLEQLTSIARQSRLPNELVVCDDGSTDRTIAMLREFAASASFPVRIYENQSNLGFAANFARAIQLCEGDLIALSDQDDIWYPHRLERSEQEFLAHPSAGLVFSDADIIDEHDRPIRKTLWQRLGFAGKLQRDLLAGHFALLAKHRFVTGATVMFRADLRDRFLPIASGWIHDEWITLIIAAFADLRPIDEPLIRYRIHASQQVGFQNKLEQRAQGSTPAEKHWGRLAESVKDLQQMCDALAGMDLDPAREVLPAYRRHLQFLVFRAGLASRRITRLGQVLTHYAQYREHASGLFSAVKDLLLERH